MNGVKYARWRERSLSRYEESRGWLGSQGRDPQNAPPFDTDPEADYRYVARAVTDFNTEEGV